MNSKERVYAAIRFLPTDKIPRFVWFGAETKRLLTEKLGLTPIEAQIKFGNDILSTWVSINGEMEREVPQGTEFVDEWGITWKRDGFYNMVTKHPLQGKDAQFIMDYPLPDPYSEKRYAVLDDLVSKYGDTYFIGADLSGSLFEPSYHLRGMEELMMDMAFDNKEINALLDRLVDFDIKVAIECIKRGADWIWLGDDLGSQRGMLMSPDMWRNIFKPRMKKIIDGIRSFKEDAIIAYHSCGSMYSVIGDLVEIGVNVLNPIQESAENMNQAKIKSEFGDKIAMMCGPDTQQFLATATTEEVAQKTKEIVQNLSTNSGYIFAVSHTIQPDIPLDNILAMFNTLDQL